MLGVICIAAGSSDHHWECHGRGHEVLYLLAGRALFTAVGRAGTDEVLVEAGDLLVLERDEAHRGRALEDVTVLFLTPRHGNVAGPTRKGFRHCTADAPSRQPIISPSVCRRSSRDQWPQR